MLEIRSALRSTVRRLLRDRGFALAAVTTLALGIGAVTGVFSVLRGVLLRPLPYPEPERLVRISEEHPGANSPLGAPFLSDLTIDAWSNARTLEGLAVFSARAYSVGDQRPARIDGASVSPALFRLLRVEPAAGRFFVDAEAVRGTEPIVVLSERLWRDRFAADPSVVGSAVTLDGVRHQVVGIAPAGFAFPDATSQLWTPYIPPPRDPDPAKRGMRVVFAIGRLAPGATVEQAAAEGTAAARSVTRPFVAQMMFGDGGPVEVRVRTVVDEMTRTLRPALTALSVAAAFLLLVACANGANLFLARGVQRQRELAVRAALGAGRWRLARQLLGESLVIALFAGTLGVAVAWALTRALPRLAPQDFPRLESIAVDLRVLAFALVASLVAGVAAGLLPAWRGGRVDLEAALRSGDARAGASGGRLRAGLLAAEAALAVMLLIGSALLLRSFFALLSVDAGFDPANVLTAQIYPPADMEGQPRARALFDGVVERVSTLPGVVAVGIGNSAPFSGSTSISGFTLPASKAGGEPRRVRATTWMVSPGFGAAMGLRVRDGRFLRTADVDGATQALVVNEEFVRQYLSDREVVGARFDDLLQGNRRPVEIVGVVADVLKDGPDGRPQAEIYLPADATRPIRHEGYLLVRTNGDPLALVPDLRRMVEELEPRAALDGVGTLAGGLTASVANPRFSAWAMGLFAGLALALTASGLFGVLSYDVSSRRRELGVRAALGESRRRVVGGILRRALVLTSLGLVAGMLLAAAGAQALQSLLFGVAPRDPVAFLAAPALLLLVAVAASLTPAWRAARVSPAEALRAD
jgi:putative ABC transport system permease protein